MKKILLIGTLIISGVSLIACDASNGMTDKTTVETTPVETTPVDTTPVETTPVDTTPIETTPVVSVPTTDPYTNMSKTDFYDDYTVATSFEDATYRTKHNLMSGSIDDDDRRYMPAAYTLSKNYMVTDTKYTYQKNGEPASYTINYGTNESSTIFYGGAYVSLNEVCAYIYAFGEVPPNSNYESDNKTQPVKEWGKYGRCNIGDYSNNTSKYKYEPELPLKSKSGTVYTYTETDFGATGGYNSGGLTQKEYNNGYSITRGSCRIVFTNNAKNTSERHVFYTFNHYNDFQEYLNYNDGFGKRFGNESNGGTYNKGSNPSPYVAYTSVSLTELRKLLGYA